MIITELRKANIWRCYQLHRLGNTSRHTLDQSTKVSVFPDDILDAYTLCEGVQSVPDGDVIMLLKYQKDMMELLPKSAKWIAETEYALNKKKSEIANAEENLDLQWNQLKLKIEGQCADELKLVKL